MRTKFKNLDDKPNPNWLFGKHVLITGASSGIGEELSKRLLGVSRKLTLIARNQNGKLDQLGEHLRQLQKEGGNPVKTQIETYAMDVCEKRPMIQLIEKIYDQNNDQVDAFINCAGGSHIYGEFETMSHQDIERIFDTNAKAPLFWLRELLPRMKHNTMGASDRKRAQVIMLSSRSGERTLPKLSVYTAAKGSIEKFVEAMQKEYVQYRIAFTLINPGSINTAFTEEWSQEAREVHNEESMTVSEAVSPIIEALSAQFAVNRISYESVQQWFNEPAVLINPELSFPRKRESKLEPSLRGGRRPTKQSKSEIASLPSVARNDGEF